AFVLASDETIEDGTANPSLAVHEVSIAKKHWAVMWLPQPIKVDYEGALSVRDAKGNSVTNLPFVITAGDPSQSFFVETHPTFRIIVHGKWSLVLDLKGKGVYKSAYTVLAPTPAENAPFELYRQGAEEALNALSHYWSAFDGSYFTFLGDDIVQVKNFIPW